jgi:hypothetical protein
MPFVEKGKPMTQLRRGSARRLASSAAILLIPLVLLSLAACSTSDTGTSGALPTFTAAPTVTAAPVNNPKTDIQQTLASFCQAVHDGNDSSAFNLLSSHYRQSLGSAGNIPSIPGNFGKLLDCTEFGQGSFLQVNGGRATDTLTMTVQNAQLGNQVSIPGNVTLVQSGTSWQIDAITV